MGVVPTLSQVENWDIEHLNEAAKHWTNTAIVWEDSFTQLAVQILNPGGQPWEGEAAEAAQYRAHTDKMTVIELADQLHDASAIAKAGAMELAEAKRLVLRTVDAAKAAGFTVGEDFSVTDHHEYNRAAAAMRQAQAEAFAADLRATVADLVAADNRIGGNLISATAGLGKDHFAESGDAAGAAGDGDRKAVTDTLLGNLADGKQAPPAPSGDTLLGHIASHPTSPAAKPDGKEPFSWEPTPADVATGAAAGIASAAHDYGLDRASKVTNPREPLLNWTRELEVKGVEIPGFTRAGGLLGLFTALPAGVIDYSEAREAGKSTAAAVGEAVAREGAGTGAGLLAGGFFSGLATDMVAGAAIGSVVPGAGTAAGLAVGFLVGGLAAFGASNVVGSLLS